MQVQTDRCLQCFGPVNLSQSKTRNITEGDEYTQYIVKTEPNENEW